MVAAELENCDKNSHKCLHRKPNMAQELAILQLVSDHCIIVMCTVLASAYSSPQTFVYIYMYVYICMYIGYLLKVHME